MSEAKKLSEAKRIELIQKILEDDSARRAFAASLSIPVQKTVDAQASVRKIFAQDNLPPGALAQYPIDFPDVQAWVLPRMGSIPVRFVSGDELIVNTFEITADVQYRTSYARDGRFDIAQRAAKKLSNAIIEQEEESGWTLIRAAISADNTISDATEGNYLSKRLINLAIAYMEDLGYNGDILFCSTNSAAEIREWDNTQLDDTTRREVFKQGGMKSIWGVTIVPLRRLGDDEAYLFDTSRFGVMPIRQKLMTFEDPAIASKLRFGFMAYEEIGFGVLDDKAVCKISIDRTP